MGERRRRKVAILIGKLDADKTKVRASAAWALGEMADLSAVRPLIAALADEDFSVRSRAARALGKLSDPRALSPLLKLLHDRHHQVRSSAAKALGDLRDERAKEPLIAMAEDEEEDRVVRRAAFGALRYLDKRPRTLLDKLLGRRKWVVEDWSHVGRHGS